MELAAATQDAQQAQQELRQARAELARARAQQATVSAPRSPSDYADLLTASTTPRRKPLCIELSRMPALLSRSCCECLSG
jgi:hypothetical protein